MPSHRQKAWHIIEIGKERDMFFVPGDLDDNDIEDF